MLGGVAYLFIRALLRREGPTPLTFAFPAGPTGLSLAKDPAGGGGLVVVALANQPVPLLSTVVALNGVPSKGLPLQVVAHMASFGPLALTVRPPSSAAEQAGGRGRAAAAAEAVEAALGVGAPVAAAGAMVVALAAVAAVAAVAAGAAAVAVAGGKGCKAAAAHAHGWLRERRKASYEEFEEMEEPDEMVEPEPEPLTFAFPAGPTGLSLAKDPAGGGGLVVEAAEGAALELGVPLLSAVVALTVDDAEGLPLHAQLRMVSMGPLALTVRPPGSAAGEKKGKANDDAAGEDAAGEVAEGEVAAGEVAVGEAAEGEAAEGAAPELAAQAWEAAVEAVMAAQAGEAAKAGRAARKTVVRVAAAAAEAVEVAMGVAMGVAAPVVAEAAAATAAGAAAVAAGAAAVAVAGGKGCKAAAAHAHGWLRKRRATTYAHMEEAPVSAPMPSAVHAADALEKGMAPEEAAEAAEAAADAVEKAPDGDLVARGRVPARETPPTLPPLGPPLASLEEEWAVKVRSEAAAAGATAAAAVEEWAAAQEAAAQKAAEEAAAAESATAAEAAATRAKERAAKQAAAEKAAAEKAAAEKAAAEKAAAEAAVAGIEALYPPPPRRKSFFERARQAIKPLESSKAEGQEEVEESPEAAKESPEERAARLAGSEHRFEEVERAAAAACRLRKAVKEAAAAELAKAAEAAATRAKEREEANQAAAEKAAAEKAAAATAAAEAAAVAGIEGLYAPPPRRKSFFERARQAIEPLEAEGQEEVESSPEALRAAAEAEARAAARRHSRSAEQYGTGSWD